MAITTKDIAKLAGVSRGTVDRALNNRGKIAPDVKARILQIAKDHGYVKNVIASSLAKNKKTLIAIVLPDPSLDHFWQAPLNGIQNSSVSLEPYGVELSYEYFDLQDIHSYSRALEKAIQNKPNAILVAPVFLKESLIYFQMAQQNNIPIACINSEIKSDDILCYIGQDSFQCGVLAGKLFELSIPKEKTIIVLTLGHHTKNAVHIDRKIDGLKHFNTTNNCQFNIIDIVCENFNEEGSIDTLTEHLKDYKQSLCGIFFTNSRANKFLEENTKFEEEFNDVKIIGFDLLEQNVRFLENGRIDFLLNQNPERQGYLGIQSIFNHLIHQKSIPKKRYLPVDIIVKENCRQYMDEN